MGDRFPVQTPDGVEMVRKDVVDGEAVVLTDEEGETYQNVPTGDMVEGVDEVQVVNAAATPMDEDGEKGGAPNLEREGMNRETAMDTLGPETGEPAAEHVEDVELGDNRAESMTEADESDAVKEVEAEISAATGTDATLTASEASALSPEEFVASAEEQTASDESEAPMPEESPEAPADATPAAEALAAEEDIDLEEVKGSGEDGRILKSDVEAAVEEKAEEAPEA